MHLDDGCEETPPRASSHHHLSLFFSFCVQKSSVLLVLRRKANEAKEAFWSVSRSFGMEKKQVLNSLSLSPLSETQRERERERESANNRRLHIGDAHHGREKEEPFSAFL